jgi:hypothetical protein
MVTVYQGLNGAPWLADSAQASAIAASNSGSYSSNETIPGMWWGAFPASPDSVVTGQVSTTDFYQLDPGSGAGKLLGQFELWADRSGPNGGALLDFVAVPEPSPVALVFVGLSSLGGMLALRRRRSAP